MKIERISSIREKVMQSPEKVYNTKTYQYWINGNGELCKAKRADLDTMKMYDKDAIQIIE